MAVLLVVVLGRSVCLFVCLFVCMYFTSFILIEIFRGFFASCKHTN